MINYRRKHNSRVYNITKRDCNNMYVNNIIVVDRRHNICTFKYFPVRHNIMLITPVYVPTPNFNQHNIKY